MVEIEPPNQVDNMVSEIDMNQQYIEDNHVVDRYLLNQLSDEEAVAFEAYYFEHPEMLEELKIAKSMQATVRQQSDRLLDQKEIKTGSSWLQRLFQPQLGFALSLLLGLGVVALLVDNNRLRYGDPIAYQTSVLQLAQSRSTETDIPQFRVGPEQTAIVLQLELGPIGYQQVQMQLLASSGEVLWQQIGKIDEPHGRVNLVLTTRQLKADFYQLKVYPPHSEDQVLSSYNFELEIN